MQLMGSGVGLASLRHDLVSLLKRSSRAWAIALLWVPLIVSPSRAQFVTPSAFSAPSGGNFTGTIPVRLPPGSGVLAPQLALTYDSTGGSGIVGQGWSVKGLSVISRCPQSIAQDGVRGTITFTASDRFCLDGSRLIVTSGTYGANGAQYRTELESFAQVTSYGATGTGPSYFVVQTKSGLTMTYGNSASSAIPALGQTTIRAWALNQVTDRFGNFYTVSYTIDTTNGAYYPYQVSYTGNGSTAPLNVVNFLYASRTDVVPTWTYGSKVAMVNRLSEIQVMANGTEARQYNLTYDNGGLGNRSRLLSVQECASSSGPCLPAISLTWEPAGNQSGKFTQNTAWTIPGGSTCAAGTSTPSYYLGDFNGDGKIDVLCHTSTYQNIVALSNGAGSFTAPAGAQTAWCSSGGVLGVGDFNGDGMSDLACFYSSTGQLYIALSNGNGTFTNEAVFPASGSQCEGGTVQYGDFDGDGRTDALCVGTNGAYRVNLSTGAGSFTEEAIWPASAPYFCASGTLLLGDFNGDGMMDMLCFTQSTGAISTVFSTGGGSFGAPIAATNNFCEGGTLTVGDFNGDGQADLMCTSSTFVRTIEFSEGNGNYIVNAAGSTFCGSGGTAIFADVNGDGKQDIVCATTNGTMYVAYSNGDGTFTSAAAWPSTSGSACVSAELFLGDVNGDGLADLICVPSAGAVFTDVASGTPDLIASVNNGVGATTSVSYLPLTSSLVYTKDTGSNAATFPTMDIEAPFYVVSSLSSSNGIGGQLVANYQYTGFKKDTTGRGYLGFRVFNNTNAQTSITSTTTYSQQFPYIGLPLTVTNSLPGSGNAGTLTSTTSTYACTNLTGSAGCTIAVGNRYFPYLSQVSGTSYDLNGAALPTKTVTYSNYDNYGNLGTVTSATSDGYTTTVQNTYNNNTTNWWIGQLIESQTTSTTP